MFSTQGGYSGVALFFLLSGYGLMESERARHLGVKDFLKRRIWKVYKPVLSINMLTYILCCLWRYCEKGYWEFDSWQEIFLIDRLDWYLWFVAVLLNCYIVFGISSRIRQKRWRNATITFGILALCCIYILLGEPTNHWISIPLFLTGVLCSEYKTVLSELVKTKLAWLIITSICFLLVLGSRQAGVLFHVSINIAQTFFMLLVVSKYKIDVEQGVFIEGLSYPIYLVHHKLIQLPLWLGNMLPVWIFLMLTIYIAWLFDKTLRLTSKFAYLK